MPSSNVDDLYVNGVSVTYGAHPHRHIWIFAAGVTEGSTNSSFPLADCPCVHNHASPSPIFIAERISMRHWITDCGPGIGSCIYVCMYVCMYVRHAFGMQLRVHTCVMATLCVHTWIICIMYVQS